MADHTHIEWTDATWNPITGCSVISPGCTNCYAMKLAGGRLRGHASRAGLTAQSKAGPVWTGEVRLHADWLPQPLRWKRPRRIFVCANGDLFHEAVPDEWIDQVFAVMALSPQHTFQVLTKRAARMREYVSRTNLARLAAACPSPSDLPMSKVEIKTRLLGGPMAALYHAPPPPAWPLPNVWLGVSAEDQPRAEERIPELLATPAAVRFVSLEPLLGPIDALPYLFIFTHEDEELLAAEGGPSSLPWRDPATTHPDDIATPRLDWVIVGGESGTAARLMHPDWARQIRDACAAAGVPFFFKQWGSWAPAMVIEGPTDGCAYMAIDGCRDTALRAREEQLGETDWTAWWFENLGKTAAGRTLDGATHDQLPQVRA